MEPNLKLIWEFINGDIGSDKFANEVYKDGGLKNFLGDDLYETCIINNYLDKNETWNLKEILKKHLRENHSNGCACIELGNTHIIPMGHNEKFFKTLREVKKADPSMWWLALYKCTVCNQHWTLVAESREHDAFILKRTSPEAANEIAVNDKWPEEFASFENVLDILTKAGLDFVYYEPLTAKSLQYSMEDLAKERPGIGVARLAYLLHLPIDTTKIIARGVVEKAGVYINLET